MLQEAYKKLGIDYDKVFERIKDVIIKTVISIEPIIVNNLNRSSKNRNLCFELYGFDVILDSELKPWLLEVNVLPSLSSSSPLDKKIKTSLLSDIFNTIGVIPFTKKRLQKELEQEKWGKMGFNPVQEENSQKTLDKSAT